MLLFPWCRIISNLQFSLPCISLPATTQNSRVAGLVVILFRFSKISPKCLTSNPLPQIATSNPRLQPNTHFAVDMFPYKKTELFQKSGFRSKLPKKPGNTPLSGTYLSFLDIKTTVSTVLSLSQQSSCVSLSPKYTGKRNFMCFRNLPSGCSCS